MDVNSQEIRMHFCFSVQYNMMVRSILLRLSCSWTHRDASCVKQEEKLESTVGELEMEKKARHQAESLASLLFRFCLVSLAKLLRLFLNAAKALRCQTDWLTDWLTGWVARWLLSNAFFHQVHLRSKAETVRGYSIVGWQYDVQRYYCS